MNKIRGYIFSSLLLILAVDSRAQQSEVIRNYISTYKDLAIAEMQRTGVPASIKLAQGIHETLAGTSNLVKKSNNHFGIKCKTGWTGESVSHDDDARGECFRKYPSAEDSYRDHSNFLKNSQRYAGLFQLDPTDYAGWANGLKKAGYATNPKYPVVLIKLIEDYGLQTYTLAAMGRPAADTVSTAITDSPAEKTGGLIPLNESVTKAPVKKTVDYPAGEFQINDTKVLFVKKGISFLSLAKKYEMPLARLFEFNDRPEAETTEEDQLVYLQRKRKTGKEEYHIVQPGETLHLIAQQKGIRLESLLELNLLSATEQIAPGERLNLQRKANIKPKRLHN